MRKLVVSNLISLDGRDEGPGGAFHTLPVDHAFDTHNLTELVEADTVLLGAGTYRLFESYWPGLADNQDTPRTEREIARRMDAIEKVVVSDSVRPTAWRDTVTVVPRVEAHKRVDDLKRGDGGNIVVFGSPVLWNDLITVGLVDEFHVVLGAGVLGAGRPAFADGTSARLRLLGTTTYEGSDNVVIRYAVLNGD